MTDQKCSARVFISHSTADREFACELCSRLEASQLECCIAPRDFRPGAPWTDEIVSHIEDCDMLVLVWSKAAEDSPHVKRELQIADEAGKQILPLRFPDVTNSAEVRYYVSRPQHISIDRRQITQIVVRQIVDAANRSLEKPEKLTHQPNTAKNDARNYSLAPRTPNRFRVILILLAVAIGLFGFCSIAFFHSRELPTSFGTRKPIVLGIYPKDGFGSLRRDGLHAILDCHQAELNVVDLDVLTTAEMKRGDIGPLILRLEKILNSENVLAIVGPPVTESVKPVMDVVAKSGKRPVMFVESAGPRRAIGWEEHNQRLPIVRLHSGTDSRGRNIALFVAEAAKRNVPVTLLVEKHNTPSDPVSYGEHLLDEVHRQLPNWDQFIHSGLLRVIPYRSNHINEEMVRFKDAIFRRGVVLMLGIGSDFKAVADTFYTEAASDAPPAAQFGSWMTAYAVQTSISAYRKDMVFEITDFDIRQSDVEAPVAAVFRKSIGSPSPVFRDQAFSFDAGSCLIEAYRATLLESQQPRTGTAVHPVIDIAFSRRVEKRLRESRFVGVTGEINLDKSSFAENTSSLIYCRYDGSQGKWCAVHYTEILNSISTND